MNCGQQGKDLNTEEKIIQYRLTIWHGRATTMSSEGKNIMCDPGSTSWFHRWQQCVTVIPNVGATVGAKKFADQQRVGSW
ncbi:jg5815 [Pararge aegeria aegeria]|uniref:Jg5815 protein n=1 Tax=Pararge aegeria aegeria TaxID=348720 RepID=A0A8S4RE55_9NEOP|nr:jg5815 [Pararge aegeria aegeria]